MYTIDLVGKPFLCMTRQNPMRLHDWYTELQCPLVLRPWRTTGIPTQPEESGKYHSEFYHFTSRPYPSTSISHSLTTRNPVHCQNKRIFQRYQT